MSKELITYVPEGGLNMDDDYKLFPKGDYDSALNCRPVSNNSGATIAYEVVLGNSQAFQLPTVSQQNKVYIFTIPTTGTWSTVITAYNAAGAQQGSAHTITQATASPVTNLETWLNGIGGGYTFTYAVVGQVVTVTVVGTIDITFTLVTTAVTGVAGVTAIISQELLLNSVPGQTGMLFPIGSKVINNDLWIFSTCCTAATGGTGGTGEIGVAAWDGNAQIYTYYTILRSKEFNLCTLNQIDCDGEYNYQVSLYFTDYFNPDRVFYYKGAYQNNGALNYVDTNNIYSYGSIASQLSRAPVGFNSEIQFNQQYQNGGGLLSGGYYYTARFLTQSLDKTDWLPLTNIISVYLVSDSAPAYQFIGNAPQTGTSKINELAISAIDTATYEYVELAAVYVSNGAVSVTLVNRFLITNNSMLLQHTGKETGSSPLDIQELDVSQNIFLQTAKNIRILNNRLLLSNVTVVNPGDYSAISTGVTASTGTIKSIPGVGNVTNWILGEYFDNTNINNYVGYMDNERYLPGLQVQFLDGSWSSAFPLNIVTITPAAIDLTTNNTGNAGDPLNVLVRPIKIHGIDLSTIDRSQIIGLKVVIAEFEPEVLGCGLLGVSVKDSGTGNYFVFNPQAPLNDYGGGTYPGVYTQANKSGLFLSADFNTNGRPSFESGDYVNVAIQPTWVMGTHGALQSGNYYNFIEEFNGDLQNLGGFNSWSISSAVNIGDLATANFLYNGVSSPFHTNMVATSGLPAWANQGLILSSSSTIPNPGGSFARYYGWVYAQYIRPLANKYTDTATLKWRDTGTYIPVTAATPDIIPDFDIFGGDTFTQKTYIKEEIENGVTGGTGIGFYSQNRVNTQLAYYNPAAGGFVFPGGVTYGGSLNTFIDNWLNNVALNQTNYDTGNTPRSDLVTYTSYNPDITYITKMGARIWYSAEKPQNSTADLYRVFLPLNYYDEQQSDGDIVHMEVLNGILYTQQPKAFRKQLMNDRAFAQSAADSQVLIQDGDIFASPSVRITTYGSKHKWAHVKVRSKTGDDNLHWLNTDSAKWMRFAGDGAQPISDEFKVRSFLANYLKFADLYDTPCYSFGICGYADNRFSEVGFTVRAQYIPKNNVGSTIAWFSNGIYTVGNIVVKIGTTFGFEGFTSLYLCIRNNGTGSNDAQPVTNTYYWTALNDLTNPAYWNVFTICFNGAKERFTTFYTFKPNIYLQHRNTFLSPTSNAADSKIWLHNTGVYSTWYGTQYEQGYLEAVISDVPWAQKIWRNIRMLCDSAMYTYFTTESTQSYLNPGDYSKDGDIFAKWIMNDILTSTDGNTRTQQTRRVSGTWLKVKVYFTNIYNKFEGFSVLWRFRNRKQIK